MRHLRWWIPLGVVVLAAVHQLAIQMLVDRLPASWHLPATLAIYSLTGSIVAWIGLSWIAASVERSSRAERELRDAFDELDASHRRLLKLQDLGHLVSRAEDEQTVLEVAARGPLELTGALGSTVITFDDHQQSLKLDMAWGLSETYVENLRRHVDSGVSMDRCRSCTSLASEATSDCPLFEGMEEIAREEGIEALVCVPMVHEQDRVGVIAAYYPSPDGPPQDRIRLLNILGGAVGAVLDGMHLRARQMATLDQLGGEGRALRDTDAIRQLADQVLEIAISGWRADTSLLFVAEGSRGELHRIAQQGPSGDLGDAELALAEELASRAHREGTPAILDTIDSSTEQRFRSAAAMPLQAEGDTFAVLFLAAKSPRVLNSRQRDLLAAVSRHIALALRNAQLYSEINRLAITEERYRLSREIHDGLAQTLAWLGLKIEQLESLVQRRAEAGTIGKELAEVRKAVREAYVDSREAIDGLRLSVEQPENLAARMQEFLSEFSRSSGIEAKFHCNASSYETEPEIALQLLRITQEALTNVRKHAKATSVEVEIRLGDEDLELVICDDGRGFDDKRRPGRGHRTYGLSTMRERAASLSGKLSLATGADQGTRIKVTVPSRPYQGAA